MRESGEMYLENILILSKRKNIVRAIDIVEEMNISKPSVSRALGRNASWSITAAISRLPKRAGR